MRWARPSDDRGLAHARLADDDGVVLGPPGQNLDDPPGLRVAPDHGVELVRFRQRGEVEAVLGQKRRPGSLRVGTSPSAAPHPVPGDVEFAENSRARAGRFLRQGDQHVLDADGVLFEAPGLVLGGP